MKFARIVFIGAGIWGVLVLTPLYWLIDITGRHYAPPVDYPHFFYGFFGVALAWQLPAMIEKFAYVTTLMVLYGEGRIPAADAQAAVPDGLLGILFVIAYLKSR